MTHILPLQIGAALLLSMPAFAQRGLKVIPDPDPLKELEQLRVAEGFEINLFASDPDIAKPTQMNWDSYGRLWVATSSIYPQLEPGETANDKIVVLEDVDGDGVADLKTTFADGLLIPTGVLPSGNGAYVANSTELLFLEDSDGDGRADKRRIVFSGFGTEDTHHILHTLRHGPGGYIYLNQSIYIHSNLETPWGPRRLDAGGVWRMRPATLEIDVWVRGFINPWGHVFDDWGQEFVTDGAFGQGINYVFPGAAFVQAAGATRILRGLSPGQPKHAGLGILSSQHLPEDYRGTFLANDFRGNRINRFAIEELQSGFFARQLSDLVWTDHVAFRPIDVNTGPDGAIYIADWYNPIIQHGEVDFRDPRRDRTHGRIWRVVAKGRPLVTQPVLQGATPELLAGSLKSAERWTREAARKLIGERGRTEMEPAMRALASTLEPSESDVERTRLEILWAFQSLDVVAVEWLTGVLASPDHRTRAAGVRVLSDWSHAIPDVRERLSTAVQDPHPRVRLEAINALRALGDADAVRRALAALDHDLDGNLDYALWLTCRELRSDWLTELRENPQYLGDIQRLVFALSASGSADSLKPAVALWETGELSASERRALTEFFGQHGSPFELDLLASRASLQDLELREALLAALLEAARGRKVAPTETASLAALLADDNERTRTAAAELIGIYKTVTGPALLSKLAAAEDGPDSVRNAALNGLAADGRKAAAAALARLTESEHPIALRARAAAALAKIDVERAAQAAVKVLTQGASEAQVGDLTSAFLAARGGVQSLALALAGKTLSTSTAAAALRVVSTSARDTQALAAALRTSAAVAPLAEELSPEALAQLVKQVRETGDPHRGERIYRRPKLECIRCHAIGGAGGSIGPDLTSIGGSAQLDYLIESLLRPDKKIKEGYHTTTVLLTDGTLASGILIRKTDELLVLRESTGEEVTIYLDEIEKEAISPVSSMPTGLVAEMLQPDLVDLVAFLSRLGKDGDFRVAPKRVVRAWQMLDVSPRINGRLRAQGVQAPARAPADFPWREITSTVAGELPLRDVAPGVFFAGQRFRIVRFGLETSLAGPVELIFSEAEGIAMFLGGKPADVTAVTVINLPAGTTVVTLILEEGRFDAENLTVGVRDAQGSPARVEFAGDY